MKMAPNNNGYLVNANGEPVSRTYQYRKVMKPMLERKRRARINRCLDELKEIMTSAFQTEGENVSKLEKADILELTVRHLHNLRRQNQLAVRPEQTYADRFKAGFRTCASEVSHFLGGFDQQTNGFLIKHLNECIKRFDVPCERKPEGFVHPSDPILNKPAAVNYHPHHHSQQPLNGLTGGDSHRYSPESQGNHYGNYHHDLSTVTPPLSPHIVVDNGIVWRPWLSSITKS